MKTSKCLQCEEGKKLWEGQSYESLMKEYDDNKTSLPYILYEKIIPFIIWKTHHKFCLSSPIQE